MKTLVLCALLLVFLGTVDAECPEDHLEVMGKEGPECRRTVWKGLQLDVDGKHRFKLPMFAKEGRTDWNMRLNGTLGLTPDWFIIKFKGRRRTVATFKTVFKKKFVFKEYKNGKEKTRKVIWPVYYPLTPGHLLGFYVFLKNNTMTYRICKASCIQVPRTLLDTDIRSVQLKVNIPQADLDLWYF